MATSYRVNVGEMFRDLRKQRKEPMRVVAAAVGIDSTLLSKIERGDRLPTDAQLTSLAAYFKVPVDGLVAQVIAERIIADYGETSATLQAIKIVKERLSGYGEEE